MKFDIDYVEKLAKVLADNSLTEISLEDGEQAITLRKEVVSVASAPVAVAAPQASANAPAPAVAPVATQEPAHKGKALTSPMVGTFYLKPSPTADLYIEIGEEVKKGDVLCIIEAMKLMNEIESEYTGKVKEILVKDGESVEYGTPLFRIEGEN